MKNVKKEPFLDRVLLHSKNADERLFDMVLRFITFVILIIIVWIYADLLHANADGINVTGGTCDFISFSEYTSLSAEDGYLWWDSILSNLSERDINTSSIPQGQFINSYSTFINSYSYITSEFLENLPIPTNVSGTVDANGMIKNISNLNVDDYLIYLYLNTVNDNTFSYYVIYLNESTQWTYGYNPIIYNYDNDYEWSNDDAFKFGVTVTYNVSNDSWSASVWGSRYDESVANTPFFSNGVVWYAFGGVNAVINANFEEIDSPTTSQVLDLNYVHYNNMIGGSNKGESDSNHLYLKDFNVTLTPSSSFIDSSVVITMSWDEWIEKYVDNYVVDIYYSLDYNGEPWSRNDLDPPVNNPRSYTMVYENIPLTKFRSYYQEDIKTILSSMDINGESALAMMNALNAAGAFTYTSNGNLTWQDVINGTSAEFSTNKGGSGSVNIGVLYSYLHQQLSPLHAGETNVFIDQFEFTVDFDIYSKSVQQESLLGGRTFDLLNGESSSRYDILKNNNPFEGSTTEGKSEKNGGTYYGENTNIAYGGNATAQGGSANISNITISGGNGYKDTELHRLTDQDIAHNHQKIITVIEDLKYCFHQFAQENNHNSFIQMIYDDYNYIPGIEYITTSIIIICGVCVLIFIIKIAF